MAFVSHRPPKTLKDYLALPDDVRAELIDGELYVTPSPGSAHQRVVPRIWRALQDYAAASEAGEAFLAPLDVHLPSGDVVQPDVLFVRRANAPIVQDQVRGVPDLVAEVLSPAHRERDRIVKRDLYARNGVGEYWLVDPEERSVEILRLDGDTNTYAPAGYFTFRRTPGASLVSATLPDLRIPLATVFEP
jgi:Uma2 family endonuclease